MPFERNWQQSGHMLCKPEQVGVGGVLDRQWRLEPYSLATSRVAPKTIVQIRFQMAPNDRIYSEAYRGTR